MSHLGAKGRFTGHAGPVLQVAFSPDGGLLATAGFDGTVRLWAARTGEDLGAVSSTGRGGFGRMAFSPDGALLAHVSGPPWAVYLWDVRSRRRAGPPLTAPDHAPGRRPAFSPDGRVLAAGAQTPGTVLIWRIGTRDLRVVQLGDGQGQTSPAVAFSSGGMLACDSGAEQTIVLLDPDSGRPVREPLRHAGHLRAISPDGRLLASATSPSEITLWDLETGQAAGRPLAHLGGVSDAAFSPDGTLLAVVGDSRLIRFWDTRDGSPAGGIITDRLCGNWSVAFSPDGRLLATAQRFGQAARIWDRGSGRPAGAPLIGHASSIFALAFSPDGRVLATGGPDGATRLWDVNSGRPCGALRTAPPVRASIGALAFSPDNRLLATTSGEFHEIRLWDLAARQLHGAPLPTGYGRALAFSPDGRLLAAAADDQPVRLWHPHSGQLAREPLTDSPNRVWALAFSPDGGLLAAASRDGLWSWNTRTWRRHTWPSEREIGLRLYAHHAVAFSPDGRLLAADGPTQGDLGVFLVATGQEATEMATGHTRTVTALAFHGDSRLLASGSQDGSIRLWDSHTGQLAGPPLTGHTLPVACLSFSPDGHLLASCGNDRTIRLWDPHAGIQIDGTGWPARNQPPENPPGHLDPW